MKRKSQYQQPSFNSKEFAIPRDAFGGSQKKGNPKTARPLDSKLPVHLVLKATESVMRRPQNFLRVNDIFDSTCKKHGVSVYAYANVGNHLHATCTPSLRFRAARAGRRLSVS